ncbi:biopolymer transport protein ExbB [Desulfobotulus alkaliphilus]|uniref:Biopolymer transport protein ExbB n=1 Tax=Desulfobotulus alkaliphilus TaxID=622671 RepID=A0A562S6B7_9BACT|nr:biopolymer transport protein ExbB [Desulfobotulus alkaliphilus]
MSKIKKGSAPFYAPGSFQARFSFTPVPSLRGRGDKDLSPFGLFFCLLLLLFLLFPVAAISSDMRAISVKAREARLAAESEAIETRRAILADREKLAERIAELTAAKNRLAEERTALESSVEALMEKREAMAGERDLTVSAMKAVSGTLRSAARELDAMLSESPFTASEPARLEPVRRILDAGRFAGMEDFDVIVDGYFGEMAKTGAVRLERGEILGADGQMMASEILSIGPFTAAFRAEDGTLGYLQYLPENRRFQMLGREPSRSARKSLAAYMDGRSDSLAMDISQGAALQQVLHRSTLKSQVESGGFLVWPILFIALVALLVTLERLWFLHRVHTNADKVMGRVNELAAEKNWEACDATVQPGKGKPVFNILIAGLGGRREDRQTLESILQEAILRELPRLERFLPMLNVMAGIAPLIGLLGTVTGMIRTFHTITLFGTGDPRMMSGGISEALATTMFGLAVAIPITLIHTFLTRRVEHIVGDMEEKAVALCNILTREHSLPACCKGRIQG